MQFKLSNVGRDRFTGIVTCKDGYGLMREIKKHLRSRGVEISGGLIFAGDRAVGEVIPMDAESTEWIARNC